MTRGLTSSGPIPCPVLILGDRPGVNEMRQGKVFVGQTGKELDRHLWHTGLSRDNVHLHNLLRQPPAGKEPSAAELQQDSGYLGHVLVSVEPKVVVTMGALATRHFLGDVSLEKVHAIPHRVSHTFVSAGGGTPAMQFTRKYTVFPMYHIAAGFHAADLQPFITYDWQQLHAFLNGAYIPPASDDAGRDYILVDNDAAFMLLKMEFENSSTSIVPGVDTEGLLGKPWGLSISFRPGSSYVVKAAEKEVMTYLAAALKDRKIALHNSLHDIPVLRELGIEINNFVDTMVMAFLLQIEPQGLKPLSWRHSGMEMGEYLEVVAPYAKAQYEAYIRAAASLEWPEGETKVGRSKTGRITKRKLMSIGDRLKRKIKDFEKAQLLRKEVDLNKWWTELDDKPGIDPLTPQIEEKMGCKWPEIGLDSVPDEEAVPYSARDADATLRLYPTLLTKVQALDLERVLDLDMSVYPMIERMQTVGFAIDRPYLKSLGTVLQMEMDSLTEQLTGLVGNKDFNPGSGDQVATFLFDALKLPVVKMTKGGKRPAVDDAVLEELAIYNVDNTTAIEFIRAEQDFRERQKLKSTYVDNIDYFAHEDNRIHSNLRTTRVVTGRLSSFDPNILAIPARTQLGRLVRAGFVAPKGRRLGAWDLDQQEIRVLAHMSRDLNMIEVLSDPKRHFHKETCGRIYGIDPLTVDKESTEYMLSKNVSFGIAYLISAMGLQAQMAQRGQRMTEAESQKMIDDWYAIYPGVRQFQADCAAYAARYGYIRTMLGRIRYLPGIHSSLPYLRSEAERAAGNHPIQGSAADITKTWMKKVWDRIKGTQIEPILQVHDELILEFDEGTEVLVDFYVKDALAEAVDELKLLVPMGCGGKYSDNWKGLK